MRLLVAIVLLLACTVAGADEEKMLYVEYHITGKQVAPDSFDAQVKKVWRIGDAFLRFEDAPNPTTKVHGLIIVAEPDIWIVDRNTNKGQHTVDPGPTFKVHFPVLASEQSVKLREIEFGRELDFFTENGATELPPQDVDGVRCKPHRLSIDDRVVTLCTRTDDTPVQLSVKSPDYEYALRFLRYDPARRPNKLLFQLPPDVQLVK